MINGPKGLLGDVSRRCVWNSAGRKPGEDAQVADEGKKKRRTSGLTWVGVPEENKRRERVWGGIMKRRITKAPLDSHYAIEGVEI